MSSKKPLVSVILPVKNGAATISRCLDSLTAQTYKNFEVIIVDNFSTDATAEIVKKFSQKNKRIKFYQKGPERASQMNYGAKLAKGKYISITNSDFTIDKNFVELAVKKCEEEGFDVCGGHIKSQTNGYWSRVKGMERLMYVNDPLMETAGFFPRKLFLSLGGFDEKMVGVEEVFQHKLDEGGYRLGIINSFQTHIDELDSIKEIILKSFYYGLYDAEYFRQFPLKAFKKRFPIRYAFIRNAKEFLKHPDLFLGFVLFKIFQYTAGMLGLALALFLSPKKENIQKIIYGSQKKG